MNGLFVFTSGHETTSGHVFMWNLQRPKWPHRNWETGKSRTCWSSVSGVYIEVIRCHQMIFSIASMDKSTKTNTNWGTSVASWAQAYIDLSLPVWHRQLFMCDMLGQTIIITTSHSKFGTSFRLKTGCLTSKTSNSAILPIVASSGQQSWPQQDSPLLHKSASWSFECILSLLKIVFN